MTDTSGFSTARPLLPPAAPASVSAVRVIRRSLRCFYFAAFGLVPFFGIGLAVMALRLFRQVAQETGEDGWAGLPARVWYGSLCAFWFAATAVALGYGLLFGFWGAALVVWIFIGLAAWFLARSCQQARSRHRNPARAFLYGGVGLANLGCLEFLGLVIWMVRWASRL